MRESEGKKVREEEATHIKKKNRINDSDYSVGSKNTHIKKRKSEDRIKEKRGKENYERWILY